MERSTMLFSWVNQLFRLGHGFQFANNVTPRPGNHQGSHEEILRGESDECFVATNGWQSWLKLGWYKTWLVVWNIKFPG